MDADTKSLYNDIICCQNINVATSCASITAIDDLNDLGSGEVVFKR